jgi:hypothetical protein
VTRLLRPVLFALALTPAALTAPAAVLYAQDETPTLQQGSFSGYLRTRDATLGVDETKDLARTRLASVQGSLNSPTAFASFAGDARSGRMGVHARTTAGPANWSVEAGASVTFRQTVTFDRENFHPSQGPDYQPIELYLDGVMGGPRNWDFWNRKAGATLTMEVFDDWGTLVGGRTISVQESSKYEYMASTKTSTYDLLLPGASNTFVFKWSLMAYAYDGWESDFSHTARIYMPAVAGVTRDAGGDPFLANQARPDWASPTPPTTTTPEPASLALVAGGALALAAVRRRVRTA